MTYKLGSLFDGSGGFPLSGALCGIEPVWAAEVEPYPIAVTRSRFPDMKHLGDISLVSGAEIEPVDIITFGSPCQDLSVAGKRAGLKHEANGDEETTRSGLFMEAVRIIKEMREATNGEYPTFALWENVPGAFSSNKGEDFRTVLEELIRIVEPHAAMPAVPRAGWNYADSFSGSGWSLAYRVFDAQYWGVPQRRRRIHLVLDLRGERAGEVLFEREGVRGYFAEGRTPWQAVAGDAQAGTGTNDSAGESGGGAGGRGLDAVGFLRQLGGVEAQEEVSPTLMAAAGMSGNNKPCVAYTLKIRSGCAVDSGGKAAGKGPLVQVDKAATLSTVQDQYLFAPTAYSFDSLASNSMKSSNPHSGCRQVEVAKTLDTTDPNPCKNQGGIAILEPKMAIMDNIGGQAEYGKVTEINGTLRAGGQGLVCYPVVCKTYDARGNGDGEVVSTLTGDHNNRITDYSSVVVEPVVYDGANVTSPVNASNPQPGDPCHTLSTDSRIKETGEVSPTVSAKWHKGAADTPLVCEGLPVPIHDQATRFSGKRGDRQDGKGNGLGVGEPGDPMNTLTAGDRHGVAYATDVGFFNSQEEVSPTLLARQYKDPHLVSYPADKVHYIVRRLTPTECARLQGFADRWGDIDEKDSFTPEEYEFWLTVRNTHAAINGKVVKDYTEAQMLTWYNKLQTDSAEYKMWGNGIALPPALYCMQGIVDVLAKEEEDDEWML